jgi:hypothetical protein
VVLRAFTSASVLLLLAGHSVALGAGDANRAACPRASEESAGFRSFLPDCRTYEMVTPPYKQGEAVHFNGLAAGGEALFGWTLASLAETKGAPQSRLSVGAEYGFLRGPGGWTPVALTPPNPEFRGAVSFEGIAPDGDAALFKMPAAPVGNDHFYLRRLDGALADVGPATPPADGPAQEPAAAGPAPGASGLAGASADMSHVVFSVSPPWGWPGAAPGGPSLYEYSATGNAEPTMVAVDGARGSSDFFGDCGATLGGPQFTSAFNAVSAGGDVVAFTPVPADELQCGGAQPAHAELYLRVDAERTVALSAQQCDPVECPQSTPSAAVFEGAASDGERGWFLSTQRLTANAVDDPEPGDSASGFAGSGCQGAVGSGCNLYEYDLGRPAGERLRAVSADSSRPHVQGVVRVSADGSRVYFVATGALAALPGPGGSEPVAGANNLYVSEPAAGGAPTLRFVATLAEGDQELWGGSFGSDGGRPAVASGDGATLLFASSADLASEGLAGGVPQLFLYRDGVTPALTRISVGQGAEGTSGADAYPATIVAPDYEAPAASRPLAPSLSADGSVAVFESAAALTPGAGAPGGPSKLYEYRDGGVYLLDPNPDGSARLIGLGESGRDAFFETARSLVPRDGDTLPDVYDARAEGGFAEPPASPACTGEACRGPAGAGDPAPPPGSLIFHAAPRRAARGRALRACRRRRTPRARHRCERLVKRGTREAR